MDGHGATAADGYDFDPDLSRVHAKRLHKITRSLDRTASNAQLLEVPADAFGTLGGSFAAMLHELEQSGARALNQAVTATDSIAAAINATTDAYEDVETNFRDDAGNILNRLGPGSVR